ncbi:MAG TPA: hypothetical protein VGA78_09095 [Gemmatimonadales bacterium]
MNGRTIRGAGLAALLLLAACGGDDDGAGPSPSGLTGTWRATKVELVNVANPTEKVELVALGMVLTAELNANETCRITSTFPGQPEEVITGTWSSSSEVFTIRHSEGGNTITWQFDWNLSGNTLTLSGADNELDFDGDDLGDPAKLNLVLVRQ